MTWLHMKFVLIFCPADGRGKLGRPSDAHLAEYKYSIGIMNEFCIL